VRERIVGDATDVVVGQGVSVLAADSRGIDQACGPEHLEVLGHGGLGEAERVDELVDATVAVAQLGDDLQARRVGKCLQQR
jgi:hypothetical protein